MDIRRYLDSTYLKTAEQEGLDPETHARKVEDFIREAIDEGFYLVMVRPEYVPLARKMIDEAGADVKVGTVIDFPEGRSHWLKKIEEAKKAIEAGADELDFVINYEAFKKGDINTVKKEVFEGSLLALKNDKVAKWIIEAAALTDDQIAALTRLIRDTVLQTLGLRAADKVFVKSSTGFYKTPDGSPSGATEHNIKIMLENADPLPVKAAGGIRTYEDAVKMIRMGVKRIGTSSAKQIVRGETATGDY
ncbi:MAG: deoxyribose-phosphate aldolase [Chlorobi bacterium]|nr:deoxyribose-phosphate aldolase [Chlorobiota bacterium]